MSETRCSHGLLYTEPCWKCELLWAHTMLNHAEAQVLRWNKVIAGIRHSHDDSASQRQDSNDGHSDD
jgi:hypothetical protein